MTKFRYQIEVETLKSSKDDSGQPEMILRIEVFGALDRVPFMQMISEAREYAHRENLNLLYDMRNMTLPENISFKELFAFASTHPMLNCKRATELRSASLLSPELMAEDIWDLYQYTSQNVGLKWMFFVDHAKALAWLNT